MGIITDLVAWFLDPVNWQGSAGVPTRILEHVWYSLIAIFVSIVVALPIGIFIGHTGRGGAVVINVLNSARAVPTFGIILLTVLVAGIGILPVIVALVALASPPIVTNTYAGIRSVDPKIREAAEGMGMVGWQVIRRVEIPVALPIIMAGIRTSAVQIVATATFAAIVGLGGLGRYIIDGLAQQDLTQVLAGAILVAALSLLTEFSLSRLQSGVVSDGLQAQSKEAAIKTKA
ncbi:MAG: ABC transporter permease [Rubrobacteraceae bacterium]